MKFAATRGAGRGLVIFGTLSGRRDKHKTHVVAIGHLYSDGNGKYLNWPGRTGLCF